MDETESRWLVKGDTLIDLAQRLQDSIKQKWNMEVLQKIDNQGKEIAAIADEMKIDMPSEYQEAISFLSRVKQYRKQGTEYFLPFKNEAYKPYNIILNVLKHVVKPSDYATDRVNSKLIAYRCVERQKAEEAKQKEEEARRKQEEAERQKLMRQAMRANEQGKEEKGEALLDRAEQVFIPPTIKDEPVSKTEESDVGSVTFIADWAVEVTDIRALAKAVGDGTLRDSFLNADTTGIKRWAKERDIQHYENNGLRIHRTERTSSRWGGGQSV